MLNQAILAQRLKEARQKAGYNQAEAAKRIGLSRSVLSKIENEDRKVDSLELREIARIYGVTVQHLLRDDEQVDENRPTFVGALRQYEKDPQTRRDIGKIEEFCKEYRRLLCQSQDGGSP